MVGNTFAMALSFATTAALVGCGVSSTTVVPSAGSGVIPWSSTSGVALTPSSQPVADRACQAADLLVTSVIAGVYHGDNTVNVELADHANDSCYLSEAPRIDVILRTGARQTASTGSLGALRVDLAPGQMMGILVGSPGSCDGQPQPASGLDLTLPAGSVIHVGPIQLDVRCGTPSLLLFDALQAPLSATPVPGTVGALMPTLKTTRSAVPGTVLDYMVTLTNPASQPVTLSPCPSYTEDLVGPPSVQATFLLNCQAAPQIGARSSLVFEMQLTVPDSFPAGLTKLAWQLQVPGSLAAGGTVTVG